MSHTAWGSSKPINMIIEGLVTTRNAAGEINVAPMGPLIEGDFEELVLRPYEGSRTLANLQACPYGVFHVTDDVLLLARSALDLLTVNPTTFPAAKIAGEVVADACRWYEFLITRSERHGPRFELRARVVHVGRLRDFLGFNRAKHAVIEAAILASRVGILAPDEVRRPWPDLARAVDKTGGPQERAAFALLSQYVEERLPRQRDEAPPGETGVGTSR